jgi:hypothetical protein
MPTNATTMMMAILPRRSAGVWPSGVKPLLMPEALLQLLLLVLFDVATTLRLSGRGARDRFIYTITLSSPDS